MKKVIKNFVKAYFDNDSCTPDECPYCQLSKTVKLSGETVTLCEIMTDTIHYYLKKKGIKS